MNGVSGMREYNESTMNESMNYPMQRAGGTVIDPDMMIDSILDLVIIDPDSPDIESNIEPN